jgi:hypothetical protein
MIIRHGAYAFPHGPLGLALLSEEHVMDMKAYRAGRASMTLFVITAIVAVLANLADCVDRWQHSPLPFDEYASVIDEEMSASMGVQACMSRISETAFCQTPVIQGIRLDERMRALGLNNTSNMAEAGRSRLKAGVAAHYQRCLKGARESDLLAVESGPRRSRSDAVFNAYRIKALCLQQSVDSVVSDTTNVVQVR